MVVKVAENTPQDSYTWRFFCESKYTNSSGVTLPGYYPFKTNPLYPDGKVYKTVRVWCGGLVWLPFFSPLFLHLPFLCLPTDPPPARIGEVDEEALENKKGT